MKKGRHGKALASTLVNPRLPKSDRDPIRNAMKWYEGWVERMQLLQWSLKHGESSSDTYIQEMVAALENYKTHIEMRIVYDSKHNFLYRNKGQLKFTSTIMEEFLERMIPPLFPDCKDLDMGSMRCVSSMQVDLYDTNSLRTFEKDQDFAVTKKVYIKTSCDKAFETSYDHVLKIPLVAVECKTYVDKTMFQESVATSNRMKQLCPHSKYFVLAEYLAMAPVDTSNVGIDRVFIARKAKRFRDQFNGTLHTNKGRQARRQEYMDLLEANKLDWDVFRMMLDEIKPALTNYIEDDKQVLERGHF